MKKHTTTQNTQTEQSFMHTREEVNKENFLNEIVNNTPFRIIGNETTGYSLTLGNHIITEPNQNKDSLLNLAYEMPWKEIMNVIAIMINYNNINNQKQNQK